MLSGLAVFFTWKTTQAVRLLRQVIPFSKKRSFRRILLLPFLQVIVLASFYGLLALGSLWLLAMMLSVHRVAH